MGHIRRSCARFDFTASGCRKHRLRKEPGDFSSNDSAGAAEFTTVSQAAVHGVVNRSEVKPQARGGWRISRAPGFRQGGQQIPGTKVLGPS